MSPVGPFQPSTGRRSTSVTSRSMRRRSCASSARNSRSSGALATTMSRYGRGSRRCAAVRSMLIIGVMPTPPAIMTKPAEVWRSLVKAPCGPSTHTVAPGGSRRIARVKSPVWRIVNSVASEWALDAIVNGCSCGHHGAAPGGSRRTARGRTPSVVAGRLPRRRRGSSTSVLTVAFSRRTSRTTNSVDGSNIGRHTQRCPNTSASTDGEQHEHRADHGVAHELVEQPDVQRGEPEHGGGERDVRPLPQSRRTAGPGCAARRARPARRARASRVVAACARGGAAREVQQGDVGRVGGHHAGEVGEHQRRGR